MQHQDKKTIELVASYCNEYMKTNDTMPSVRQLAKDLNISKSTAQRYLNTARNEERLTVETKRASKGELTPVIDAPIPCGAPDYQEENISEYVCLPESLFGRDAKFILRSSGDSMINAGIEDGDMLVCRKTPEAQDGSIIVALLNGANTLKTLRHDKNGHPYLHPENEQYEDIRIHEGDDFYIQGVLIYVLKNYRGYRV